MIKFQSMLKRIFKSIFSFISISVCTATIVFFLSRLIPSDPTELILGENASYHAKEELKRELGLDKPLLLQYIEFLKNLFTLNFGKSFYSKREILSEIRDAFKETFKLAIIAIIFSLIFSLTFGITSSISENKTLQTTYNIVSTIFILSPSFLIGPILLYLLAVKFPIFPIGGGDSLASFILPSLILSIPYTGHSSRILKTSLNEEKTKSYYLNSLQKGNSKSITFFRHLLPNAVLPYIQISSIHFGGLLTGSIIAEKIFRIDGLGSLMIRSIFTRDYPLLTFLVIFYSFIFVFLTFIGEIISSIIDPRLK